MVHILSFEDSHMVIESLLGEVFLSLVFEREWKRIQGMLYSVSFAGPRPLRSSARGGGVGPP